MTLEELNRKLVELGITDNRYYLHGLYGSTDDNDKLALSIKREKHAVEFEVYFKERGEKHSTRTFTTEDEACQYMYKRLKENKETDDKYSK